MSSLLNYVWINASKIKWKRIIISIKVKVCLVWKTIKIKVINDFYNTFNNIWNGEWILPSRKLFKIFMNSIKKIKFYGWYMLIDLKFLYF